MAAIGGPIESVNFGGRGFAVAQDSDPGRDIGGRLNSIAMNGDETGRILQDVKAWKLGPVALQIDDEIGDQEFLQTQIDSGVKKDFTVTYVDGSVYYGSGTITDAAEKSPKNATMDTTFSGAGKLKKQ